MSKVIAIDYDGTLALNSWPGVGEPNWSVIGAAKAEKAAGNKLVLWTCREGEKLQEALDACESWGLTFDAVNENLPEMQEAWGNDPRKLGADEYWDDRAVRMADGDLLYEKLKHHDEYIKNVILIRCQGETAYDYARRGLWGAVTIAPNKSSGKERILYTPFGRVKLVFPSIVPDGQVDAITDLYQHASFSNSSSRKIEQFVIELMEENERLRGGK